MFGALRLFLAMVVGISHVGIVIYGLNPGVIAVVVFFLISGYVTNALLEDPETTPIRFYAERLIRLMPSYWLAMLFAIFVWQLCRPDTVYLSRSPLMFDWLSNITLIPLNYFYWTGQYRFHLLPATWSLALEIQYYLIAPFLFYAALIKRACLVSFLNVVFVGSLCLYLFCMLGDVLDSDIYGYRLLPSVLWIFIAGGMLRSGTLIPVFVGLASATLILWLTGVGLISIRPFNVETAVGFLGGVPVLAFLSKRPRYAWDEALAKISYPFFLSHFATIWVFQSFGIGPEALKADLALLFAWLSATLLLSTLIYILGERPFNSYRRRLRTPTNL